MPSTERAVQPSPTAQPQPPKEARKDEKDGPWMLVQRRNWRSDRGSKKQSPSSNLTSDNRASRFDILAAPDEMPNEQGEMNQSRGYQRSCQRNS